MPLEVLKHNRSTPQKNGKKKNSLDYLQTFPSFPFQTVHCAVILKEWSLNGIIQLRSLTDR